MALAAVRPSRRPLGEAQAADTTAREAMAASPREFFTSLDWDLLCRSDEPGRQGDGRRTASAASVLCLNCMTGRCASPCQWRRLHPACRVCRAADHTTERHADGSTGAVGLPLARRSAPYPTRGRGARHHGVAKPASRRRRRLRPPLASVPPRTAAQTVRRPRSAAVMYIHQTSARHRSQPAAHGNTTHRSRVAPGPPVVSPGRLSSVRRHPAAPQPDTGRPSCPGPPATGLQTGQSGQTAAGSGEVCHWGGHRVSGRRQQPL